MKQPTKQQTSVAAKSPFSSMTPLQQAAIVLEAVWMFYADKMNPALNAEIMRVREVLATAIAEDK